MKVLRERFPSWQQVFLLFIAASFPVNVWAMINFLRVLPSFLLRLRWGEIVLVASYAQTFALLESVSVLILILFLGILMPGVFLRNRWVAKGTILVWLTSIWTASYHFFPDFFPVWKRFTRLVFRLTRVPISDDIQIMLGFGVFLTIWASLYFQLLLASYGCLRQGGQLSKYIFQVLDRIRVLALVYVMVDVAGLLIAVVHFMT